jgi:hypothetical protein
MRLLFCVLCALTMTAAEDSRWMREPVRCVQMNVRDANASLDPARSRTEFKLKRDTNGVAFDDPKLADCEVVVLRVTQEATTGTSLQPPVTQ